MKKFLAAISVAVLTAGSASAASLTINSVTGVWTDADPAAAVTGIGSDSIWWGQPATWRGQSGYKFEGEAPPPKVVNEGQHFLLGKFKHYNNPIYAPSITSAKLEVSVDVAGHGIVKSVFEFDHWETPNYDRTCANGGRNGSGVNRYGCADRVMATLNEGASDMFVMDGTRYMFDISGFYYNWALLDEFWTKEKKTNKAYLKGHFVSKGTVVPLPAGLPLLMGGIVVLGGLGAARGRKDKAA